jgi:glycosyltransferase involved in cell wall biosynthesis
MKILIFTENYYKGGLDTFLINLINAWPNKQDELNLLCNGTHLGLDYIEEKTKGLVNINRYYRLFTSSVAQGQSSIKWMRSLPMRALFILIYRLLQYPVIFPWYIFSMAIYFKNNNFDRLIVVNGGYPASLLCRTALIAWGVLGKRPLAIMNFHSSVTRPKWYFYFFEYLIDTLVNRFSTNIVSVSNFCLSSLSIRSAFKDSSKLSYIFNGIQDPLMSLNNDPISISKKIITKRYCLMLSTYQSHKGHYFLLKAFENVLKYFPDLELKIYGYGRPHEKKQVANKVIELGLEKNVVLNDFTPNTAELLSSASVLVVPSQYYEAFGLTIIEAMAFGVPVVTTDVGGMPEVLEGSNAGYVCSKDDPLEFARAIKNILSNPLLAAELGKNGRLVFEKQFTATKMANQYKDLLKN